MEFYDDKIVANSVSVQMSTCGKRKFDFGTFNAAVLKMGIIDSDALAHDFADAAVGLTVTEGEGQQQTTTYLGTYYVDGQSVKRNKNEVTFTAYDKSLLFDIPVSDNVRATTYTALTAIQAACTAAGVTLDNTDLNDYINISVTFNLANTAIQTWRDVVIWTCQLIAGNAIMDRYANLKIIHTKMTAQPAATITASERQTIDFSDVRIYPKYLTSYSGKKTKTYMTTWTPQGDTQFRPGKVSIAWNPLLADKSEADCDTINAAIIDEIKLFEQRQIVAKCFSRTDIGLGDTLVFSGGKIDVRHSVRGIATDILWKYHGVTTITCTAPDMYTGA